MKNKTALLFALLAVAALTLTTPAQPCQGQDTTTSEVATALEDAATTPAPTVQEAEPTPAPTTDPVQSVYVSVSSLALVILPVVGWLKTRVSFTANWRTQTFSWPVGLALAWAGHYLGLGIFAETGPLWTTLYGLAAAFTANALATTELIDAVLVAIGARVPKTK